LFGIAQMEKDAVYDPKNHWYVLEQINGARRWRRRLGREETEEEEREETERIGEETETERSRRRRERVLNHGWMKGGS